MAQGRDHEFDHYTFLNKVFRLQNYYQPGKPIELIDQTSIRQELNKLKESYEQTIRNPPPASNVAELKRKVAQINEILAMLNNAAQKQAYDQQTQQRRSLAARSTGPSPGIQFRAGKETLKQTFQLTDAASANPQKSIEKIIDHFAQAIG